MTTITKNQTKTNTLIATEIKEEIVADANSRQEVEGVKLDKNDIAEMLNWMRTKINAKNGRRQNEYEPVKKELVEGILEKIKPGNYFFRNRDIGYLTQYAENALADNGKFYKTVQAIFRKAQ